MQLCWIIFFVLFSFTIADSFSLLHIVCLFQKNYIFCNVDVNMKPLKILLSMCMISTWHAQIITYNFSPCFYLFASWNGTIQVLDVTLILLIHYYLWYYSKSIYIFLPQTKAPCSLSALMLSWVSFVRNTDGHSCVFPQCQYMLNNAKFMRFSSFGDNN